MKRCKKREGKPEEWGRKPWKRRNKIKKLQSIFLGPSRDCFRSIPAKPPYSVSPRFHKVSNTNYHCTQTRCYSIQWEPSKSFLFVNTSRLKNLQAQICETPQKMIQITKPNLLRVALPYGCFILHPYDI